MVNTFCHAYIFQVFDILKCNCITSNPDIRKRPIDLKLKGVIFIRDVDGELISWYIELDFITNIGHTFTKNSAIKQDQKEIMTRQRTIPYRE